MSTSKSEEGVAIKRKRGMRRTETYKQNKIKRAKLRGEAHINYSGKEIHARCSICTCVCSRKCFEIFNDDACIPILTKINDFASKDLQDVYLQGMIELVPVKTHRPRKGEESTARTFSVIYTVDKEGKRVQVCKKAFLSIHDTTAKRMQRLIALLKIGTSPTDGRGKNYNSRTKAMPPDICEHVAQHIESFEVKEAHYTSGPVKYLNAELNIKIMHALFTEKHPDAKVSYAFYYNYFKSHYSLRFGRPQVDVCSKCEELKTKMKCSFLNENAKKAAAAELMVHTRRAKKFYSKLKEIKTKCEKEDNVMGISLDYMQNVPLPHIPVQEVFYYRQLWVYVFGIHDLLSGNASFHLYHEGIGRKSPNEVCTLLNEYIASNVPENVTELHIFSDGCTGQNRNHTVVRFLLSLAALKRFDKIYHYFPIRGHSFLPCDRDFGVVKRKLRHIDRVYTPEQYNDYVVAASTLGKFTSTLHTSNFCIDYKKWWPKFFKKNTLSTDSLGKGVPKERKVSFQVSNYCMFEYDSSTPGVVKTRHFIDGLLASTFRLSTTAGRIPKLPSEKSYSDDCPVAINVKKIEDVKKLLQYVPDVHSSFYRDIVHWKTVDTFDDPDAFEAY